MLLKFGSKTLSTLGVAGVNTVHTLGLHLPSSTTPWIQAENQCNNSLWVHTLDKHHIDCSEYHFHNVTDTTIRQSQPTKPRRRNSNSSVNSHSSTEDYRTPSPKEEAVAPPQVRIIAPAFVKSPPTPHRLRTSSASPFVDYKSEDDEFKPRTTLAQGSPNACYQLDCL